MSIRREVAKTATSGLSRIQGPTAFLIAFYRQVSANRIKYELMLELFGPNPERYRQIRRGS